MHARAPSRKGWGSARADMENALASAYLEPFEVPAVPAAQEMEAA